MKEPSAAELLREYFRRSGDAVLYIEKDRVTFATPAACALLGRNAEGQLLERLFPLWPEEDGGVAAVELGGRGCRVIRSRLPGADCLRLQPEGEAVPAPAALLQRLRSSLAALRLSTDRLVDPETESPYAPVLNRSYYAMLHGVQQLSDRNAILRGDMALRRDAVELGKLLWELTGSVDTFAGERGVELTCDVAEKGIFVTGDRDRLEQLILILPSNRPRRRRDPAPAPPGGAARAADGGGHRRRLFGKGSGPGLSARRDRLPFRYRFGPGPVYRPGYRAVPRRRAAAGKPAGAGRAGHAFAPAVRDAVFSGCGTAEIPGTFSDPDGALRRAVSGDV